MVRLIFATLFFTLTLLFLFQVRTELLNPWVGGLTLVAVVLSLWHIRRVLRGTHRVAPLPAAPVAEATIE